MVLKNVVTERLWGITERERVGKEASRWRRYPTYMKKYQKIWKP